MVQAWKHTSRDRKWRTAHTPTRHSASFKVKASLQKPQFYFESKRSPLVSLGECLQTCWCLLCKLWVTTVIWWSTASNHWLIRDTRIFLATKGFGGHREVCRPTCASNTCFWIEGGATGGQGLLNVLGPDDNPVCDGSVPSCTHCVR